MAFASASLLLLDTAAWGEDGRKPAVSGVNGTITGTYSGFIRSNDNPFDRFDYRWRSAGGVSGAGFVPLGSHFGFGAWVGGLWGEGDGRRPTPFQVSTTPDYTAAFAGAGFFWRDPDTGLVGLFYGYTHEEQQTTLFGFPFGIGVGGFVVFQRIDTRTIHDVTVAGRWYLDDVDLALDGSLRITVEASRSLPSGIYLRDPSAKGFEFGGTAAAYAGASDRVRVGLDARAGQVSAGAGAGYFQGRAFADWQPDLFGNRHVRLGGAIGGGASFNAADTLGTVTASATISVDWPGTDGLKQLFREQRI